MSLILPIIRPVQKRTSLVKGDRVKRLSVAATVDEAAIPAMPGQTLRKGTIRVHAITRASTSASRAVYAST